MDNASCPVCHETNIPNARFCASCGAALSTDAEDVERLVGTLVGGRFRITRVIAEGGMGVVYAAEQKLGSHVREVAVKTLLPSLSRDHSTVQRFYRESGTVAQLEHPNTIKIFDFGEAPDGSLYIAMEYVRGQSLAEAIQAGPLPVERVVDIVLQVCGALHEAHEQGIVHRDLKPDNIVLTERAGRRDFVKLLDFGIAARTTITAAHETKLTQQGMVLGTPPYMSPEQFAGEKLDRRSDLYSLGIIAFEMLSGRLPFEAETPWAWAHKHMAEPLPELPPHVPENVVHAVRSAAAKQRDRRPGNAVEFAAMLAESLSSTRSEGLFGSHGSQHRYGTSSTEPSPPRGTTAPNATAVGTEVALRGSPFAHADGQPGAHGVQAGGGYGVAPRTAPGSPALSSPWVGGTPQYAAPTSRRQRRSSWSVVLGVALAALIAGSAGAAAWLAPTWIGDEPPPDVTATPADRLREIVELPPSVVSESRTPKTPEPTPAPRRQTDAPVPQPEPTPTATSAPGPIPPITAPPLPTLPPFQFPFPTPTPAPQPTQTPQPTPTPQPTQTPQPTPQPTPPAGADGTALCLEARRRANRLNIEGAVQAYRQCDQSGGSEGAKQAALAAIRTKAAVAVRNRANAGNCDSASSAVSAASSVGAGDLANAEWQNTNCPR